MQNPKPNSQRETRLSAIEIRGLAKEFRGATAISGLDLDVDAGSLVTLLGPSGCGKTTTLRCVAGLESPDEGSIKIGDLVVTDVAKKVFLPPERRRLGMVFQSYALWPHLSVKENIALPLRLRKTDKAEIDQRVTEVLETTRLSGLAERLPNQLSGGQQQRVAVARSIVYKPKVLLLDEPLSNLDAKLRREMRSEIRDLQKELAITMLYVTHDQEEALEISDTVCVMSKGKIVQRGLPREIHDWPGDSFTAGFVGFQNILEGVVEKASREGSGRYATEVVLKGGMRMKAESKTPRKEGEKVAVAIREEDVEVSVGDSKEGGFFQAELTRVGYAGSRLELECRAGGDTVRASAEPDAEFKVGQKVYVRLPSKHGVVVGE